MFSETTKTAANNAASNAKQAVYSGQEDIRKAANNVPADFSAWVNEAGHQVRHLVDNAGDQVTHAKEQIKREIRLNPLRSGLIALGIGAVVGFLARGR